MSEQLTNGGRRAFKHFLKFVVSGITAPFVYEVIESESKRIRDYLNIPTDDKSPSIDTEFVVFDTADSLLSIAVAIRHIDVVHFLEEPADHSPMDPLPEREDEALIYLQGQDEPYPISFDDPRQAAELISGLDSQPYYFDAFYSIVDDDGEMLSLNVAHIKLVEIEAEVVHEGQELLAHDQHRDN